MISKFMEDINSLIGYILDQKTNLKSNVHLGFQYSFEEWQQLLSELEATGKGDWYCPECKEFLCAERVENDETCDTCGSEVLWVLAKD